MTITQNDLEILKTEVMADTPDGGGLPTAEPIADGVSNNLFPDVSDIDALTGRVRLRKIVLAVKTATAELLQAARFLITEMPDNENMSVFAFKATSFADRRSDAKNKIESYLAFGSRWAGHVLEAQLEGQRVIQISLDLADPLPSVGQALVMVQNEGLADEFYQYVRVLKVETIERRFQRNVETSVTRRVATIEISEGLKRAFNGLTVQEFYQNTSVARRAILREARIADAAKYYSASHLAEPVTALASRQVKLESIFTQIVPSTQVESPLIQRDPVNQQLTLIKSSDGTIQINQTDTIAPSTSLNLPNGVYAGTLSISVNGKTLTDSDGELIDGAQVPYASIKYDLGQITWYDNANWGSKQVTGSYSPASAVTRVSQTDYQIVDDEAGYSYVRELGAEPVAGSLTVTYQVNGRVYVVHDDGRGSLVDSSGNGRGTVRGKTVLLATEAIPDAGSHIIYTFSSDLGTTKYNAQTLAPAYHVLPLDGQPVGDITIIWGSNTATASNGVITGDATGKLVGNELQFAPKTTLATGTEVTLSYDALLPESTKVVTGAATVNGSGNLVVSATTTDTFIGGFVEVHSEGGMVKLGFDGLNVTSAKLYTRYSKGTPIGTQDFGNGDYSYLIDPTYSVSIVSQTVDATGKTINAEISMTKQISGVDVLTRPGVSPVFKPWTKTVNRQFRNPIVSGLARTNTATEAKTPKFTPSTMYLELPKTVDAPVLPGSLNATVFTIAITDKSGAIFSGKNQVGTIDYEGGVVALTSWAASMGNNTSLQSMTRENDPVPLANIIFRTPVAPIKKSSLQISCTLADGTDLSLSTDAQGNITGSKYAHGTVDFKAGVVALYFYEKLGVTANPSVVSQPWYDAANIYMDGGTNYINKPYYVKPDSVRYNAIAYTYLPLNSEIIGLDPVRLPTDGRVQFVQAGDSIAITELKTMQLPTYQPNDSFDLGFERLSDVTIVDGEGVKVSYDVLNIDLDAGIVTLDSSFSAATYAPPFTAKYRIMDLAQVVDTDISGRVTISTPITHDYSTQAVFSTMLLAGDMQSRVANILSQKSWNGVWSDQLVGVRSESQIQTANNPIVVTNRDAITERWALIFTGSTSFRILGETVGEIGTGSIGSATAPINLMTGQPYFTVPSAAWGSGWDAGNVVRFNTIAAAYPLWIGNAIQQHQLSRLDTYDFTIGFHANIDRERI